MGDEFRQCHPGELAKTNPLDLVKGMVDGLGDRVTWTYDNTYQLLSEDRSGSSGYAHTFTYDPVGNRLTKDDGTAVTTYVYDAANRLQTAEDVSGVTTHTFDANGNERSIEEPSGDLTTYTWTYENQMSTAEDPAGDVTTYTYAPVTRKSDELRVQKETDTQVTNYLWDGENLLRETDDLGAVDAEYTLAPQPYGNLISQRRDAASSFYHYDALGSTRALTDSSEVETDDYAYEAFGKVASSTGSTTNPFRWVGEKGYYADEETSLYSLRRRHYASEDGRFVSEDPIGFAARDTNLYRYVSNNSPTVVDPSGLDRIVVDRGRVSWMRTNEGRGEALIVKDGPEIGVTSGDGWVQLYEEYGGGFARIEDLEYWAERTTSVSVRRDFDIDHILEQRLARVRHTVQSKGRIDIAFGLVALAQGQTVEESVLVELAKSGDVRAAEIKWTHSGLFTLWAEQVGTRPAWIEDVVIGEDIYSILWEGGFARDGRLMARVVDAQFKTHKTDAELIARRSERIESGLDAGNRAAIEAIPVVGTISQAQEGNLRGAYFSMLRDALLVGTLAGTRLAPRVIQARALRDLGVNRVGQKAFLNGELVSFKFATAGGDDVVGFVQFQNGRLTSQLFSINNPNPDAAAKAFLQFRNRSMNLARQMGAKSVEFQGGSVINRRVEAFLRRHGFTMKTVEAPEALGGGTHEVYSRIVPVE